MPNNKYVYPINNNDYFNDFDILNDFKESIRELLNLYFNYLTTVDNESSFNLIEEVTYELIEDYRSIIKLLNQFGWNKSENMNNIDVLSLIFNLKDKRKKIENNNNNNNK